MRIITTLVLLLTFSVGFSQTNREIIIDTYLTNGAYKHHYTTHGWEDNINQGIKKDSTIAELWQNKALPYWKMKKYDVAVSCYDKAVFYDRKNYLGRRGYLKCIFQRDYKDAIADMEAAEKEFGYGYQNDHSYPFYISLCYLQLNEFKKAEQVLQKDFDKTIKERGKTWIHFLDLFYMGIIQYELRKYDNAISYFDKALAEYSEFSDAEYYKGLCLIQKGDKSNAEAIMLKAKKDFERGFTINEDDSFYEPYPYKVNWHMAKWTIPNYKE
ncbi:tetratricopeptide repeat protein [Flavobacterium microcysteis]